MPPSQSFEQLADVEVPPLPTDFDRAFHQRLNHSLVALQMLDLLVRGLPYAFGQFGRAVLGLIVYSFTGHFVQEKKRRN